jgi:hypothetical protein
VKRQCHTHNQNMFNLRLCKLYNQASCFVSVMSVRSDQCDTCVILNIITAIMMLCGVLTVSNMPGANISS